MYFCPHCKKDLAWKTYCAHQRLYFNVAGKCWIEAADVTPLQGTHDQSLSVQEPQGGTALGMDNNSESPPSSPEGTLTFMTERHHSEDEEPSDDG